MLPIDAGKKKNSYSFMAAFYLGFPLAAATSVSSSWPATLHVLSEAFSKKPDLFLTVTNIDYPAEVEFPLGRPFVLRHRGFFELFDLKGYLSERGFIDESAGYTQESLIWICPSGVVLIMASAGFDQNSGFSLEQFEDEIVEERYAELSFVFSEVAEIVMPLIRREFLDSALCCRDYIEKHKRLNEFRTAIAAGKMGSGQAWVPGDYFQHNEKVRDLFEDALIDIYYVEFYYVEFSHTPDEPLKPRVDYVDSSFRTDDFSYPLYLCIGFSSFIGFRCLVKHLTSLTRRLGERLVSRNPESKVSPDLKLLRIFCLQFIHESGPIQIMLKRKYMELMEDYSAKTPNDRLIAQINEQLSTLDQMVNWQNDTAREIRNQKIAASAIILAVISVMAVAAQMIDTLDVKNGLGVMDRCLLIAAGFIFGMAVTVGIYVITPAWRRIDFALFKKK